MMFLSAESFINPEMVDGLSGLATVVIAIFTIVYAWTTKSQLKVMSGQLTEMESQRKLYSQPVVVLKEVSAHFEKPNAYTSPNGGVINLLSRFHLEFEITNIGNTPIVGGKIYAELYKDKSDKNTFLKKFYREFCYVEAGKQIKSFFLLPDAEDLLEQIIEVEQIMNQKECEKTVLANEKMPFLDIKTVYKNITGGYFISNTKIRMSIGDDFEKAKDWYSVIKLGPMTFQKEIIEHNALLKTNKESASIAFDNMRHNIEESLKYTDDLKLEVMIDDIEFKIIDEDTYEKFKYS